VLLRDVWEGIFVCVQTPVRRMGSKEVTLGETLKRGIPWPALVPVGSESGWQRT
jgi:hypothetical protein